MVPLLNAFSHRVHIFGVVLGIGFNFWCGFGHRVHFLGHLPRRVHTF